MAGWCTVGRVAGAWLGAWIATGAACAATGAASGHPLRGAATSAAPGGGGGSGALPLPALDPDVPAGADHAAVPLEADHARADHASADDARADDASADHASADHASADHASADAGSAALLVPPGLDPAVYTLALQARACAGKEAPQPRVLSVIDFRLPSSEPRLWVVDTTDGRTLFHERVAHGRTTGDLDATRFSNVPGSNASSIGLYRTAEVYTGKHGRSLRLDGLDPGWNDRARDRAIVVHGASYSTAAHVARWGRLGRSQGCPALDPAVTDAVIDTIRDGTLLFAYYPDADWLSASPWLNCDDGVAAK